LKIDTGFTVPGTAKGDKFFIQFQKKTVRGGSKNLKNLCGSSVMNAFEGPFFEYK